VFKESATLADKDAGSNALDQSGLYLNKTNQVHHNGSASKADQQTQIVSTVELPVINYSSAASTAEVKRKCTSSGPSESQRALRERKEDRWATSQSTASVNPFGDFVTNTLRQDCSLNFPGLPSALPSPMVTHTGSSQAYPTSDANPKVPSSQTNVTSSFSIAQTSSNLGILSWSTLPSADTYSPARNNSKLARFHDIFPYRNTASAESAAGSTSYAAPVDPKSQTHYVTAGEHSFFPETLNPTSSKSNVDYLSGAARSRSDGSQFEGSGKKHFFSKQTFDQGMSQQVDMGQGKQLCPQESYDKHQSAIVQYLTVSVQSKQDGYSGNSNKTPGGKQIFSSEAYSRSTANSGKHANYAKWNDPKVNQSQQDQSYPVNVSAMMDPKSDGNGLLKRTSNNLDNPPKERTTFGTYVTSNASVSESRDARETRMSQCNQSDTSNVPQQKQTFKAPDQTVSQAHKQSHYMNSKNAQKHYQQSELQHNQETNEMHEPTNSSAATLPCARSAKTTMSIHRPPVNWMTAPDIRSSLQNTPAFGNNQTAFYIPDHSKELDSSVTGSLLDTTNSFHCLDLPHTTGQGIMKSSDLQLLGSDQLEGIHEPTAWSPSKTGNNNVLGSMLIPSTLPTLVGDLALGDSSASISRPFLPTLAESSPCSRKTSKRAHSMKNSDKAIDDGQGAEFSTSFLSVSQLVDSNANRNKGRQSSSHNRMSNVGNGPTFQFPDQDVSQCTQPKQSSSKCPSSSYSAEALLSNPAVNSDQINRKKRSTLPTQYNSNYTPSDITSASFAVTSQPQCNFLPDSTVSRSSDFQSGLSHTESVPNPFMLSSTSCNLSSSHRNGVNADDESQIRRVMPQAPPDNLHLTGSMAASKQVPSNDVGMTYESNFPSFLPPVSIAVTHYPYAQDSLYTTPRFQVHPNVNNHNNNVQSPSANTLTNFHLSTIFPEINGKVLC